MYLLPLFKYRIMEFCSPEVVEIALNFDVLTFNSGHLALRPLLERLGCYCGPLTCKFLSQHDINRVWLGEHKVDKLVKKRRQALHYNIVELGEQSINEEGEIYCAGGLIDVLDTSKYQCMCAVHNHALKYMITCNSNFDHNYLKTRYFNLPTIIFYLFLTQIIYIIL